MPDDRPSSDPRVLDEQLTSFARAESAAYRALADANGGRSSASLPGAPPELVAAGDSGSLLPFANMAHVLRRPGEGDGRTLSDAVAAYYREAAGGPFFLWDVWSTIDAAPSGLIEGGRPPVMRREPNDAMVPASALEVVEVRAEAQLAEFERVLVEAYPAPMLAPFGSQPRVFDESLLGGSWRLFVGFEDGVAVATAAGIVADDVVLVEAVSTRPECRGQGYGAALTDAAARGAGDERPAMLVASDLGRPVYEGLGFETIARAALWMGDRS